MQIRYWQCPQDGDHVYDYDDWRIVGAQKAYVWKREPAAVCPEDGRELELKKSEVRP